MRKAFECARCGRELRNGEAAYEQIDHVITVSGTTVKRKDVRVLACEDCA